MQGDGGQTRGHSRRPNPAHHSRLRNHRPASGIGRILQLAIIDGNGTVLLNQLYKPDDVKTWPDAQRVNHISPRKVSACPSIQSDLAKIQSILDRAQEVCVYNAEFDLAFLGYLGLRLDETKVRDTMEEYGRKYHGTKYYKLEKAAQECGYQYRAHDAHADCLATLKVQERIDGRVAQNVARMEKVVEAARRFNEAKATEQGTGDNTTIASTPRIEKTPSRSRQAMVKIGHILYLILLWTLVAVDVLFIAASIAAPPVLIFTVPLLALTAAGFWGKGKLKPGGQTETSQTLTAHMKNPRRHANADGEAGGRANARNPA